jgi:hypothetical protein
MPLTRAAFGRGELTFTKVRALTRVATASSEEGLLDLAGALTASQLERALRAFRRVAAEDAAVAHELEYVDYFVDDDGTLWLGCDADVVARIERDGLPVSVGRSRRTVPPALRRLLETRDDHTCCFPGCERRRHLQAHHREHWAHGGETSLDNLVLLCYQHLCYQHHRVVHEGGYTVEGHPSSGFRFLNRYGVAWPLAPPRPPPGRADDLLAENNAHGLRIDADTNQHGIHNPLLRQGADLTTSR